MAERMQTCAAAYMKGVKAAKIKSVRTPNCPYGETKKMLRKWWHAGYTDQVNGLLMNEWNEL